MFDLFGTNFLTYSAPPSSFFSYLSFLGQVLGCAMTGACLLWAADALSSWLSLPGHQHEAGGGLEKMKTQIMPCAFSAGFRPSGAHDGPRRPRERVQLEVYAGCAHNLPRSPLVRPVLEHFVCFCRGSAEKYLLKDKS